MISESIYSTLEDALDAVGINYVKIEKVSFRKNFSDSLMIFKICDQGGILTTNSEDDKRLSKLRKTIGYIGVFIVEVRPKKKYVLQEEWDIIRRQRYIDIIAMLYNTGMQHARESSSGGMNRNSTSGEITSSV